MKIGCVLVLFNPNIKLLENVVRSLIDQVDLIYFADNSPHPVGLSYFERFKNKFIYKQMTGNIGIAAAQNEGVNFFLDNNFDYLIFMDQDSIAPNCMIQKLLYDLIFLTDQGITVGAIGARPVNRQTNRDYKGIFKKGFPYTNTITEVVSIISSSSLVPCSRFTQIGLFESDLFIDGVDHEWCWRGKYLKGFRFFISENVKLSHQLGEGDKKIIGINISISTPFRSFYQYRNYFILLRRNYVPLYWKFMNGLKYLIKYFYYPLCVKPRWAHFKNINKGIWDGLFLHKLKINK